MQTPRLPLSAMVRWLLNRNIYRLPARWLYVFRPQTPSTEPDFRGFAAGRKVDEDRVRGHGASPSRVYTLSKQSYRKKSVRRLTDDESRWRLHFETTTPNFNLAAPYAEMLPRCLTTCKGVESRVWRNYTSGYLTGRTLGFIEKHVEYYLLFLIRKFLLEFIIIDIIFFRRMNLSVIRILKIDC